MALSQESSHHQSSSNITSIRTNSDLPPFQPFPAAQEGCLSNPATGRRPSPKGSDINYGTQRHQATDNGSMHSLIHSSSACGERQRVACLSEFTPFPSAPPSHRYAPPEGLRAVQPQPIPLPEYAIQTNVSCPPVSPLDAIQYLSEILSVQSCNSCLSPALLTPGWPYVCEYCDSKSAQTHDPKNTQGLII